MPYSYSSDKGRLQVDVIHGFLSTCYWSPGIRRDVVEQGIANSHVIAAYDDGTGALVGYARAVTDYATFAWLCDVFVLEAHRGKGIADTMLRELFSDPRFATLRRWCLATRDAHALYRRHGFTPVPAERWMEMKNPVECWSDESSGTV